MSIDIDDAPRPPGHFGAGDKFSRDWSVTCVRLESPRLHVYHFVYLSRITGRVGDTGLRDILQRSREQNARLGITGALLFDGERFVQLLEGPREVVLALVERIRHDPRHSDFTPLYEGPAAQALFRHWEAGYLEAEDVRAFEGRVAEAGPAAPVVDQFLRLLGGADVA